MIRNFKVLGLAMVAALALTAFGASAASAAEFHSSVAPVKVTGSQSTTHVFTTDPGTVTCTTATFAGEQSTKTAASITITPTYSNCTLKTIFGNIAVTVDFKTAGCDYHFNASGHTEIKCTTGNKSVVVSGPGCTVTVPAQTLSKAVSYSNNAGKTDIIVDASATGISYSYTGFTCGSGSGTTNGTYDGNTTMVGTGANIWYE
jgi:hypothetical protein